LEIADFNGRRPTGEGGAGVEINEEGVLVAVGARFIAVR
jgi:hypothetical protein